MHKTNNKIESLESIRSTSSKLLMREARKRGISVEYLNSYREGPVFLELWYRNHEEFIFGQDSSVSSHGSYLIQRDKALTKIFLKRAGISVARGRVFKKKDSKEILKYCKEVGFPVVLKQWGGSHGRSVIIGIKNAKDLSLSANSIFQKEESIIVEKMFKGEEYRIIATRDKFLAAVRRIPANVEGDGVNTIKKLILMKNLDPRRGDCFGDSLIKIKVGEKIISNLKNQKLRLNSIPAKGERVLLLQNSNISTGGDSIDVTDKVHPDIKKIAINAVRAIQGLGYGGVDFMTSRDISKKPSKNSYIVVEINSSPGFDIHHFPYEGKSRDVARGIIDVLFPETMAVYANRQS